MFTIEEHNWFYYVLENGREVARCKRREDADLFVWAKSFQDRLKSPVARLIPDVAGSPGAEANWSGATMI